MQIDSNDPDKLLKSIKPDNLENIRSYKKKNEFITEFKFKDINQAIASLDDLIKCIDVSKEVTEEWEK